MKAISDHDFEIATTLLPVQSVGVQGLFVILLLVYDCVGGDENIYNSFVFVIVNLKNLLFFHFSFQRFSFIQSSCYERYIRRKLEEMEI